jgi:UDP-glucose 4-epimerase
MSKITVAAETVAVTGGAGFIGSHLVDKLLAMGKRVVVFDNFSVGERRNLEAHKTNPRLKIIEGDVRDIEALTKAFIGVDYVYHLAVYCVRLSLVDPATNHDINATGTLNALLAASRTKVKRFIYCSSSEVYGLSATTGHASVTLGEDSPKLPTTVYGGSKLVGELYTLAFHQTHGLPAMVVRPFNAYGPRAHITGAYGEVIPRFSVLIKAGRPTPIFGDGSQTRDFTYVEDTAAALIAASGCDRLLGDSINIARGQEVSVRELMEQLCQLTGNKPQPKFLPDRPGDIQSLGADTRKSKQFLEHVPSTPITEGLKRYLGWLDAQRLDYQKLADQLTEKNWLEGDTAAKLKKAA